MRLHLWLSTQVRPRDYALYVAETLTNKAYIFIVSVLAVPVKIFTSILVSKHQGHDSVKNEFHDGYILIKLGQQKARSSLTPHLNSYVYSRKFLSSFSFDQKTFPISVETCTGNLSICFQQIREDPKFVSRPVELFHLQFSL